MGDTFILEADHTDMFALFISEDGKVQWDYIHGLVEFAIYGGRVDNPFDNRVMVSYLKQLFNNSLLSEHCRGKKMGPLKMPGTSNYRVSIIYICKIYILPLHINFKIDHFDKIL